MTTPGPGDHARAPTGPAPAGERSHANAWRRTFDDHDEQAECIADLFPQRYDQLGSGKFLGEMVGVEFDGVRVVRERVNRRLFQAGTVRNFSVAWALDPAARYQCDGYELGPERMMVWTPKMEFEVLCDPSEMCVITLSDDALEEWNGISGDAVNSDKLRGIRVVPPILARSIRSVAQDALAIADGKVHLAAVPGWRDSLRDELLGLAMTVADLPGHDEPLPRRCQRTYDRVVQAVRDQIAQDRTGSLTIDELCRRIGVSRRNLHYAFEATLGMPPGQFLRTVRLNEVRRAIKRRTTPFATVADLASSRGFEHPSHFAADYKRRFGELPSQTAERTERVQI